MTPDEFDRWLLARELGYPPGDEEVALHKTAQLVRRKAEALRLAAHHRNAQAEATAAGDPEIARRLGMLAAHKELIAALSEAEIRDRAAKSNARRSIQQKQQAASKPRPKRAPLVKIRITNMMLLEKRAGAKFKTLMQRWEREPLQGLRLVEVEPGVYTVDDEDDEGVAGQYKIGTLQKMFSTST